MHMAYAAFPYLSAILLSCVIGMLAIMLIPPDRKMLIKRVSALFLGDYVGFVSVVVFGL